MKKIFLSIDLVDWHHTPAITGSSFAMYKTVDEFFKDWNERYDYFSGSTIKILVMFKKYDIRATFFVIADQIGNLKNCNFNLNYI